MSEEGRGPGSVGLVQLGLLFARLSATAFGGPAAHIAMMERELVQQRELLTPEEFLDLVGASNAIPGPTSTEVAMYTGRRHGGVPGLLVAGLGFIAPAALIVGIIAWAYARYGAKPAVNDVLDGVKPVVLAIVSVAVFRLGRTAFTSRLLIGIGAGVLIAYIAGLNEPVLLLAASAVAATARFWTRRLGGPPAALLLLLLLLLLLSAAARLVVRAGAVVLVLFSVVARLVVRAGAVVLVLFSVVARLVVRAGAVVLVLFSVVARLVVRAGAVVLVLLSVPARLVGRPGAAAAAPAAGPPVGALGGAGPSTVGRWAAVGALGGAGPSTVGRWAAVGALGGAGPSTVGRWAAVWPPVGGGRLGALGGLGAAAGAAAAEAQSADLPRLFAAFLKIGALLFGSGYVLLAFLKRDFVDSYGWLTEGQLLDAIAIGQVTPGPLFTTATFVGYLLRGVPGAIVATVAIFLPAFVMTAVLGPVIAKLRDRPTTAAALDGLNAAAVALMAGVTWVLARDAVSGVATALLAGGALLALLRFRVNPVWLMVAGAAVGLMFSGHL